MTNRKLEGLLLGLLAVLVLTAGTNALATTTCEQDCMDQYDADVQACEADLAMRLADEDEHEQWCIDNHNGEDPNGLQGCLNSVAVHRRNAQKKYQQCLKLAEKQFNMCLGGCAASPF